MGTNVCKGCNGVGSMRPAKGAATVCSSCNGRGYTHGGDAEKEPDADDLGKPKGAPSSGTGQEERPPRKQRPLPKKDRF